MCLVSISLTIQNRRHTFHKRVELKKRSLIGVGGHAWFQRWDRCCSPPEEEEEEGGDDDDDDGDMQLAGWLTDGRTTTPGPGTTGGRHASEETIQPAAGEM